MAENRGKRRAATNKENAKSRRIAAEKRRAKAAKEAAFFEEMGKRKGKRGAANKTVAKKKAAKKPVAAKKKAASKPVAKKKAAEPARGRPGPFFDHAPSPGTETAPRLSDIRDKRLARRHTSYGASSQDPSLRGGPDYTSGGRSQSLNPLPISDFGNAFSGARGRQTAATGVGSGGRFNFGGNEYTTNRADDYGVTGGLTGPQEAPPQFGVTGGRQGPAQATPGRVPTQAPGMPQQPSPFGPGSIRGQVRARDTSGQPPDIDIMEILFGPREAGTRNPRARAASNRWRQGRR